MVPTLALVVVAKLVVPHESRRPRSVEYCEALWIGIKHTIYIEIEFHCRLI